VQRKLSTMLKRDWYPDRFHGKLKIWVQVREDSEGLDNPRAVVVDILALNGCQGIEHINVPLMELMYPRWDEVRAAGVLDDVVEPLLEK